MTTYRFDPDSVKRVALGIYSDDADVIQLKMYDRSNKLILKCGAHGLSLGDADYTNSISLKEGERLVGIKAYRCNNPVSSSFFLNSLQFIIASKYTVV